MRPTVGERVAEARRRLAAAPFRPPGREALLLMGRVLGLSEAQVLARDERPLAAAEEERFAALLDAGWPASRWPTCSASVSSTAAPSRSTAACHPPPRDRAPDRDRPRPPPARRARLLDVGTGSGCIAVTLALELPAARVVAGDLSPGALVVAAANARRHRVAARVRPVAADLLAPFDLARFDLVVSNPPYVDPGEAPALSPEVVAFEPAARCSRPAAAKACSAI